MRPRHAKVRTPSVRHLAAVATIAAIAAALFAPGALARSLYTANYESDDVAVLDTATNQLIGSPIPIGTGTGPYTLAITPDGKTAYVVNYKAGTISAIDTATNQVAGESISIPEESFGIGITPDGSRAYVGNNNLDTVSVIDLQARKETGLIPVGESPAGVAIAPDGKHAYVSNGNSESISVIDTATNQVVGTPIPVGGNPYNMAVTPDGRFLWVANQQNYASVIDTSTNQVSGTPIPLGEDPSGIAISPNGARAYVTNYDDGTVSVIDTATKQVLGSPIPVGPRDEYLTVTPDGTRVFVGQFEAGRISAVDTATNQVVGTPATVGAGIGGLAVVPDQGPTAAFSHAKARPGVPVTLNGSASSDPDGTVAGFAWAFGDKKTAGSAKAKVSHTYKKPGTYKATLTVADNEGCSTTFVFTGQTASCNGSAAAGRTKKIEVAYPGVRVKCPASAGHAGCKFKLKAVAGKGKGKLKAQSAAAKAKVRAGGSKIVSLKPKKAFRKKLAKAKKVLVQEVVTIAGSSQVKVLKLKIVQ